MHLKIHLDKGTFKSGNTFTQEEFDNLAIELSAFNPYKTFQVVSDKGNLTLFPMTVLQKCIIQLIEDEQTQ